MSKDCSIPNIFTMNPDEVVRMFRDQPENFLSLRIQSRDAHRLSIEEIKDLESRVVEQLNTMNEVHSLQTKTKLRELLTALQGLTLSYQEFDTVNVDNEVSENPWFR